MRQRLRLQRASASDVSIHEQDIEEERRFVYYGETNAGRLLALVATERGVKVRLVTAYGLDAGQRRDYYILRGQGGVKRMNKKTSKMPNFTVRAKKRIGGPAGRGERIGNRSPPRLNWREQCAGIEPGRKNESDEQRSDRNSLASGRSRTGAKAG
jgi:hypothetical protein